MDVADNVKEKGRRCWSSSLTFVFARLPCHLSLRVPPPLLSPWMISATRFYSALRRNGVFLFFFFFFVSKELGNENQGRLVLLSLYSSLIFTLMSSLPLPLPPNLFLPPLELGLLEYPCPWLVEGSGPELVCDISWLFFSVFCFLFSFLFFSSMFGTVQLEWRGFCEEGGRWIHDILIPDMFFVFLPSPLAFLSWYSLAKKQIQTLQTLLLFSSPGFP